MKQELVNFYNDVVKKTLYWLPLLLILIATFGYSLFNVSISTDDLWSVLERENTWFQTSRWGMGVWLYLTGTYTFSPFLDEFIALIYLSLSAVGLSFLFYYWEKSKDVLGYLLCSSAFITYPLINEIWCYSGANFFYTGGLLCGVVTIIILNTNLSPKRKYLIASLLMAIPATSYEAPVFSYVSLVCILVLYKYVIVKRECPTFLVLLNTVIKYIVPVFLATILKFIVPFAHNLFFNTPYVSFGATEISWAEGGFFDTITSLIHSNIYLYFLTAIIYFPITVFVLCAIIFGGFMLFYTIKQKSFFPLLGGVLVFLSIFSQSIIQGVGLPYRTAQGLSIFVAFTILIIYQNVSGLKNIFIKWSLICLLFLLSWHQGAFVHKINSLNVLRSDCEVAMVHDIGRRLMLDYKKKPVVFVSEYSLGTWVNKMIHVDENSWNGKLFFSVCNKIGLSIRNKPVKYIGENVKPYLSAHEILTPKMIFEYYGYDIDVICSPKIISQAISVAKETGLSPYQIMDYGPYIIVQLGAKKYYETNTE